MGEARRRKAIDPTFGKPKRGLVISAPIEINGNSLLIRSSDPDPQELRSSLLYWDELVWPTNNLIHIPGGPDIEFLETAKILARRRYNFSEGGVDVIVRAHTQAFEDLDKESPGLWALSQGENSLLVKDGNIANDAGVAIELYRAIPVPDKAVPLNEILEFRHKRYDELTSLRLEIDQLIASVNSSADPKDELAKCLRRIDEHCAAAIKVGSEWKFPVKLSNLKTSIDLKPFAVLRDGVAAYLVASELGISGALVAGLLGATASVAPSIKISSDFGWNGLKSRTTPYRYVSRFHKELF